KCSPLDYVSLFHFTSTVFLGVQTHFNQEETLSQKLSNCLAMFTFSFSLFFTEG
ncbi:unnamed protein product, partial [Musa textilis]